MKIESFDTIFSLPADQLTREEIITILIKDDIEHYMSLSMIIRIGFVGYENQTDAVLCEEYIYRRDFDLLTYGTDAENGMTV
jgi:hypothetical protein